MKSWTGAGHDAPRLQQLDKAFERRFTNTLDRLIDESVKDLDHPRLKPLLDTFDSSNDDFVELARDL